MASRKAQDTTGKLKRAQRRVSTLSMKKKISGSTAKSGVFVVKNDRYRKAYGHVIREAGRPPPKRPGSTGPHLVKRHFNHLQRSRASIYILKRMPTQARMPGAGKPLSGS